MRERVRNETTIGERTPVSPRSRMEGAMSEFLLALRSERGQALVEFAFIGPLLLFFILIVVDFGIAMDRRELVQHAVREGARRAAVADGLADIKDSTHNQSAGTLDQSNVNVCFVDRNDDGSPDAGDMVRVTGDYTYKFSVGGGEVLAGFGIGPPSIDMSPSAEERLEKPASIPDQCPP